MRQRFSIAALIAGLVVAAAAPALAETTVLRGSPASKERGSGGAPGGPVENSDTGTRASPNDDSGPVNALVTGSANAGGEIGSPQSPGEMENPAPRRERNRR